MRTAAARSSSPCGSSRPRSPDSVGRLDGKVALISGAARGQGEAEARRFVAEGAKVVIGDVLEAEGEAVAHDLGDDAVFVKLDVTSEEAWQEAVASTVDAFGGLHVLVNNAGVLGAFTPARRHDRRELHAGPVDQPRRARSSGSRSRRRTSGTAAGGRSSTCRRPPACGASRSRRTTPRRSSACEGSRRSRPSSSVAMASG